MTLQETFDAVVVGGGPAGATAATDLARSGHHVMLLDRNGRIKPCGGAIPPRLIEDFAIPDDLLVAKINCARMVAPSAKHVDIPINNGFVGMVDREVFDEWLRNRAASAGADRREGRFIGIERDKDGTALVRYRTNRWGEEVVRARMVIGADGANSAVARDTLPEEQVPYVFAYHEVIEAPPSLSDAYDPGRCDVIYDGRVSPDFYGWVFPHGKHASVGVGSANKGFSLRGAVADLRRTAGLEDVHTIRCEGAPIPLQPKRRWDNGRDVLLAGDAAGCVAPSSGEGIYYAMTGGRLAAQAVEEALAVQDARALAGARKMFLKEHGQVFWVLGIMQKYWYSTDNRRERFVRICHDKDVQQLTFDAYMNKRLVRAKPMAHMRIFFKNVAHLTGLAPA